MLHAFRDDERRRITVTASGTVSFVDLVTFLERQLAGDAWRYAVLHDARAATTDVTVQDLSEVVGHIDEIATIRGRGPVAVVSTHERYLTTAKIYADMLNLGGGRIAVFGSMMEASDWLDRQIADPV